MEAGGDKDGIWALVKSGLRYVTVPRSSSVYLSPLFSIGATMAHVPYVTKFILSAIAMGRGGKLRRTVEYGQAKVLKRLEAGSKRKDLFYHLVCQYIICPTCSLH